MAKGFKTGGRVKGSINKVTQVQREKILASGLTPLEYMLNILRDENAKPEDRFAAAKEAAPYVHHRLSSIEGNMNLNVSHEDVLRELETAVETVETNDAAYH